MELEAIETLAIETFQRVRERFGDDPVHGKISFALEIVPGEAKIVDNDQLITMRSIVWEGDDDQRSIRDVKEQQVCLVPREADDERIPAYLEGLALGIRRVVESGTDIDSWLPHDFIPWRAFRDPDCKTAAQFAALVGKKSPDADVAIDDATDTAPIATNPELERAIDEDPDRVETFLVYADWLTQHDDPRGEVISCMANSSHTARQRAHEIISRKERYFSGTLAMTQKYEDSLQLGWKFGFFEKVRIAMDYDLFESERDFAPKALRGVMRHYSSRFLRELEFGYINFESGDYEALYPILVEAGPRPLRRLFIGDTHSEQQEISWTSAGDFALLRGLYRNLRDLKIRAGRMQLVGALDYPKLESLVIETGGLSAESVREIARTPFPHLRNLELWFGSHRYGASSTIEDLAPILAGEHLPALKRLALRNCEFTDAICDALATAPVVDRITELDLSMGMMSDHGARSLVEARKRFAHLTKVDVSQNYLTRPLELGVEVVSDDQRRPDIINGEEHRYVSVGE